MGVHESQSRFYENLIGRSRAFIGAIYPKVQEFFPAQLGNVTAEQFYRCLLYTSAGDGDGLFCSACQR